MKIINLFIMFCYAPLLFACHNAENVDVTEQEEFSKVFRGICIDDDGGEDGLYNPERGLRLEVALDVETKKHVWKPLEFPDITSYLESENKHYASDSISLVQTYFYLTKLVGKDLSEENLQTMDIFFKKLRELGKKAVLRFAYETTNKGATVGPTKNDIIRHASQLQPFLEKNKDVIQVLQAGMIGAWGEWHSSVHGLERSDVTKKEILESICAMTPAERFIQVRLPSHKNLLSTSSEEYRRISFHDDMIVIKEHPWDGGMSEGTPFFNQIVKESPYVPVDGELPWGTWSVNKDPNNPESCWMIDGKETARKLFLQHFTSLSVTHNYKEDGDGVKYSMQYWKETPISEDFLLQNKMPISDSYFQRKDGTKVERSVFDYIRDHLGYRIELRELKCPKIFDMSAPNSISISLVNRGFSTLFNEHPVYLVLLDEQNKVVASYLTGANVNEWQPYDPNDKNCEPLVHKINAEWSLDNKIGKGTYKLGLWIPDGSQQLHNNYRYAVRCANGDVDWWISPDCKYGINVLTSVLLQ